MQKWTVITIILSILISYHNAASPVHDLEEDVVAKSTFFPPANWKVSEEHQLPLEIIHPNLPDALFSQNIKVKYTKIKATMSVRPTIWSLLFRSRDNRVYVIRVNNNEDFEGVLYQDVPINARAGLWAHELMHIKDFESRGFFGVLQRAFQYLTIQGRTKYEYEIDQMVINAGLEYYLYAWSYFVLEESQASDSYLEYKREVYLTPEEILELLDGTDDFGYIPNGLFIF